VEINHVENDDEPQAREVFNQTKNEVRPLIFHNEFTFIYMTLHSNASRLLYFALISAFMRLQKIQSVERKKILHSLTANLIFREIASVCLLLIDDRLVFLAT
jgi:hypothetical protein